MWQRVLEHPEISAALFTGIATLAAAVVYTLATVIRQVPRWIERRLEERLQTLELQQSEIDARAMRDRAIADAIVHAASVNAQAMEIIRLQTNIIKAGTPSGYYDEISSANLALHNLQKQLKEILEGIRQHDKRENANSGNGSDDSGDDTGTRHAANPVS